MDVRIDGIRYVATVPLRTDRPCTLGSLLQDHRKASQITLDEVAHQVGISKTYLWELETGASNDPSFAIVVRLAWYYGISLDILAPTVDRG